MSCLFAKIQYKVFLTVSFLLWFGVVEISTCFCLLCFSMPLLTLSLIFNFHTHLCTLTVVINYTRISQSVTMHIFRCN